MLSSGKRLCIVRTWIPVTARYTGDAQPKAILLDCLCLLSVSPLLTGSSAVRCMVSRSSQETYWSGQDEECYALSRGVLHLCYV